MIEIIKKNFQDANNLSETFVNNQQAVDALKKAALMISHALIKDNKVIACGNGGSMCDAMHFAEELTGRFRENRRALAAIAICDPAHITCVANDFGFDFIFSRSVEALGQPGDILLAITSSGNSQNQIEAAKAAKSKGMKIIGLTGKTGGKLAGMCDVEIRAPRSEYADRAQEIHIRVLHTLIQVVETEMKLNETNENQS